jgi:O-acetyl-ADP-ribose deacetylase (regulator of RNase III)
MINYVDGDVVKLAKEGAFDVVVHGCNCLSTMGAGVAPQMAKAFGCDKFEMERSGPSIHKLGNIDYETLYFEDNKTWTKYPDEGGQWATIKLTVVNAYTQYMYGRNHVDGVAAPFDYEAFTVCMRKMNHIFKGKHIGMPRIGSHLAGGDWDRIEKIIEVELSDCKVTVVNYKP